MDAPEYARGRRETIRELTATTVQERAAMAVLLERTMARVLNGEKVQLRRRKRRKV